MPGRRSRPLSHETIRKDFKTFSAAWAHAARQGLVARPFPSTGLVYPKTAEKAAFRTRAEIEVEVGRGIGDDEAAALWKSLFLTLVEVGEFLELVCGRALHPWIFPMVAIAAHTGMRRSEILRSRVVNFDLVGATATVARRSGPRGS